MVESTRVPIAEALAAWPSSRVIRLRRALERRAGRELARAK